MADDKASKGLIGSRMSDIGLQAESGDPFNYLAGLLAQNPYIFKNQWFFKQDITLDGYAFENCKFEGCKLFVAKGSFQLMRCSLTNCTIFYSDDALRTIQLFQANLPPGMRSGGATLLPSVDEHGRITIG